MDYIKARTYIDESHRFGGEMGLEAITCLLEKLGNPQETLQFIHIAGTNGKGSVGAYLAAVLQEAGYRIGRFISPTLYEYRERIQINGVYIEEELSGAVGCGELQISLAKFSFSLEYLVYQHPFVGYHRQCASFKRLRISSDGFPPK